MQEVTFNYQLSLESLNKDLTGKLDLHFFKKTDNPQSVRSTFERLYGNKKSSKRVSALRIFLEINLRKRFRVLRTTKGLF